MLNIRDKLMTQFLSFGWGSSLWSTGGDVLWYRVYDDVSL